MQFSSSMMRNAVLQRNQHPSPNPNPNPDPNPDPNPNPNQVDSRALRVELARADKEAASGTKPY